MFCSLWSSEVYNDIFENGLNNRNLSIIHQANKTNNISIVLPQGKSENAIVSDCILQGETFAPYCVVHTWIQ